MKSLSAFVLAVVITALPAQAAPADAEFGDTVTTDVKLTGDRSGSGSGLIIGADCITIDLNGYTLSSDDGTGFGIDNSDGYDNVTIKNGTIDGFQEGIRSDGGDDLVLKSLAVSGAIGASADTAVIHVLASCGLTIKKCEVSVETAFLGPHSIRLDSVQQATVKNVTVTGGFIGVSFFSVDPADDPTTGTIKNCTVEDCFIGILIANSDDAVVKNNVVRDANGAGVGVAGSQGIRIGLDTIGVSNVEVVGNEATAVGVGILASANGAAVSDLLIKNNEMSGNNRGILGVLMQDSTVKGNEANDNELFGLAFNDCDGNEIRDNVANENGLRGIVLVFGSDGNLIRGNRADGNGFEGITLFLGTNVDNTIEDNEAFDNGVWDLFHNVDSTPNSWNDNDFDTASGADI